MTERADGNEAVRAAAERAKYTAGRNLPKWDDLPVEQDTANLREGPDLHERCLSLLPLIGVWRGTGEADYPTIDRHRYGQQIVFSHDGRPFVHYEARAWLLDEEDNVIRQAAREVGWWRPQEDDTIEVMLAHHTGVMEIYYGKPRTQTSWEFATDIVMRTASAKEVNGATRLYGLIEGGDLGYVEERAMAGQSMQPHISARLQRIAG